MARSVHPKIETVSMKIVTSHLCQINIFSVWNVFGGTQNLNYVMETFYEFKRCIIPAPVRGDTYEVGFDFSLQDRSLFHL